MALNDSFIRQSAKYSGKKSGNKYTDGGGMYLLVTAAGKYWRFNYRFEGKRKTLALGVYPVISLAEARKRRDKAREGNVCPAKTSNLIGPLTNNFFLCQK